MPRLMTKAIPFEEKFRICELSKHLIYEYSTIYFDLIPQIKP